MPHQRDPSPRSLPEPDWMLDPPEAFEAPDPDTDLQADKDQRLIDRYLDSLQ